MTDYYVSLKDHITMAITDWPTQERPREKLLSMGSQALSDAELLAIFLRTGIKGKSAVDLARDLLNKYKTLNNLFTAPQETFCESPGLGMAKYAEIKAILEISRRHLYQTIPQKMTLKSAEHTKHFLKTALCGHTREVFACIFLDAHHRTLAFEELFYGTINCAAVYPREVVKRALYHNAAAVIFSHNHPSGDTTPSTSDKAITFKLVEALKMFDIRVLDHMIVGDNSVSSFAEMRLI